MADKKTLADKALTDSVKRLSTDIKMLTEVQKLVHGNSKIGKEARAEKLDKVRRSEGLKETLSSTGETARFVSKFAGMEKGAIRVFEDTLASFINKDENIKSALKRGDSDVVRKQMVDGMLKISEGMEHATSQDKANFKLLTENLKENFDTAFDWDKIEEKGSSIFFPLTQKFFAGAEMMRSSIVDKFPVAMKFLSADMVEHYRQGIGEVAGMVKREFAPILAPLDAIVGPFGAVLKGGFMLIKTFMSQSTDYEQSTADYTQKTYEILQRQYESDRKEGLKQESPKKGLFKRLFVPLLGLFVGFFGGLFGEFKTFIKILMKPLTMIMKPLQALGKKLGGLKIFKKFGVFKKLFAFFGRVGKWMKIIPSAGMLGKVGAFLGEFVGKLLMPFFAIRDAIAGWTNGDTLRNKILGASAGILSSIMEFPGIAINKLMEWMGINFKVDFSAKGIIDGVNSFTKWMYDSFTEPFLDALLIDLPKWFSGIGDSISETFNTIKNLGATFLNGIIDSLISKFGDVPLLGPQVKKLEQFKMAVPDVGGAGVGKQISSSPKNPLTAAQSAAQAEQIRMTKESVSTMNITNREIEKGNKMQMQAAHNQNNVQINNSSHSEIPTDPENMGLLLQTKGWGMGGN